jgi:hypothetical protein
MTNSAQARVVASFTFIVVLMLGAWAALDQQLTQPPAFLITEPEPARLLIALLPIAATWVAYQAANAAAAAWARTLGSATVMLGTLASLGGVLYFVSNW